MSFTLHCAAIAAGPSVAPCVDAGGTSYAPIMVQDGLLTSTSGQLSQVFAAGFTVVMICFVVGVVVGSVIRLIRSA